MKRRDRIALGAFEPFGMLADFSRASNAPLGVVAGQFREKQMSEKLPR